MTVLASSPLVQALSDGLRGAVVAPDDGEYDSARKVYNGMIDRRPAAIARCVDVADVITAVRTCRELGARVSVRGGGHNAGGLGVWDDAACIDLGQMRGISVDPTARTVRAEGGCTWGDVDHATHPFGLATPTGIISTTGVGGLTLGGGMGHLTRHYGLTIDNLLSADVVLADGSFVTANQDEHPDLFWALRGGGGNFGIVTAFQYSCHDMTNIYGGPVFYDIGDTGEVLRWYREVLPALPEEINGWFAELTVPPADPFPQELWLRKACAIVWNYSGPQEKGPAALAELRAFGRPILDAVQEVPYPAFNSMFDALYPPGLQWYWRADFFTEISDAAIAAHEEFGSVPTMHSTMHLYPVDGAAHRVGPEETAFAYRDAIWSGVIVGVDPDPANAGMIKDWTVKYWDKLHPTSAGGAYVNFMSDDEGGDRVKASYRHNYERLTAVKAQYDPDNFFSVNQNISPAIGAGA